MLMQDIEVRVFRSRLKIPVILFVPVAFLLTVYALLYLTLNSILFVDSVERNLNEILPGEATLSRVSFDATLTRVHLFDVTLRSPQGREVVIAEKIDASLNAPLLMVGRVEFYDILVTRGGVRMSVPEEEGEVNDLLVTLGLDGPSSEEEGESVIQGVSLRDIRCKECFYGLELGFMSVDVPRVDIPDATLTVGETLAISVGKLDVEDVLIDFQPRLFNYPEDRGVWSLHVRDVGIRNWKWANEGFAVESVELEVDGIQVQAHGDMRFPDDDVAGGGMLYWGDGTIKVPYWSRIAHYFVDDHVHAQIEADVSVRGSLDAIQGMFYFDAPVVEAAGLQMQGISGTGALIDDMVFVDSATGTIHGGEVEVSDVFYSMFEGVYAGKGWFKSVDPAGALSDFGFDYPWLAGRADGRFSLLGWVPYDPGYTPGDRPYKARIAEAMQPVVWVTFDESLRLSRSSREVLPGSSLRIDAGAEAWANLDSVGVPDASIRLEDVDVRVKNFTLNYLENRLRERAMLDIAMPRVGRVIQAYGGPNIDGKVFAEIEAHGLMNYPELTYRVRGEDTGIASEDVSAGDISLQVDGGLSQGRLRIDRADLTSPRGEVSIEGWLDLLRDPDGVKDPETGLQTTDYLPARRDEASLRFDLTNLDLSIFETYLPDFLGARGQAFARAELSGSLSDPLLDFSGRIEEAEVLGQPLRELEVEGVLESDLANIRRFVLDAGVAGSVDGSGAYHLSKEEFAFAVEGRELSLEKVVALREQIPYSVQGMGSFSLHGTGTLETPNVAGNLIFRDLRVDGRDVGDLALVANTLDETVYLVGSLLPWIALDFEVPLDESSPLYARIGLDHVDLVEAVDELAESPLVDEFEATGMLELFMERDFSRYQVVANLSEIRLKSLDRSFRNHGPIIAGFNDGDLIQIQQMSVGTEEHVVSVEGGVFLEDSLLDLRINGELDLALLNSIRVTFPEYFPDALLETHGLLDIDATLRGPPGGLLATGSMQFQPTEVVVRDMAEPVVIAGGTIQFDRSSLRIDPRDPIRGQALQGHYQLVGSVGFEDLSPSDLNLRVEASNMAYRLPGVASLTFGADLELVAPDLEQFDTWSVNGDVTIVDGRYYESISIFQEQLTNRVLGVFDRKTETYEASLLERFPMLEDVRFDVGISARDGFRVESEVDRLELDLDLRLDVRLRSTLSSPQLDGEIGVLDGRVTFQGERFDVRTGSLRFDGDPGNPWVDIVADSDVNNRCREPDIGRETRRSLSLRGDVGRDEERIFHIVLNIQGELENMSFQFESNPYADRRDILSLILTGCTVDQLTASSASSPTLEVALAPVLGWIEGTVQDVVEVEEFTITPSVDRLRTSIGDRITRRLRWRLEVDTGLTEPTGGQLAELEYKISDAWSAELRESSRSEDDSFVIDFKLKYRLFLD